MFVEGIVKWGIASCMKQRGGVLHILRSVVVRRKKKLQLWGIFTACGPGGTRTDRGKCKMRLADIIHITG